MQHNVNCLVNSDDMLVLVREAMVGLNDVLVSEATLDALVYELGAKINARFEVVPVIDDFKPELGSISFSLELRKKGAGHG
ncbi:hypothetical protein [Aliiroseovarius crassostreae]|nr:hypothetical protein [Aliiroseovarius crassostreae]